MEPNAPAAASNAKAKKITFLTDIRFYSAKSNEYHVHSKGDVIEIDPAEITHLSKEDYAIGEVNLKQEAEKKK